MPKYKRSAITSKRGINFIRSAVENSGSLFIKIDQSEDLGIDALIELIDGERPLNKQIAVQIKSGQTYYSSNSHECAFPVDAHKDYWTKHTLPVFGIVFVPSLDTAHWINIKNFFRRHPDATIIRYLATKANEFNLLTFNKLFVPAITQQTPILPIEEAIAFVHSDKQDEQYLGLLVLFRRYANNLTAWNELVGFFMGHPVDEIPSVLIYWFAHIPGHGDIFYFGETPTMQTQKYVQDLFAAFGYQEIVKLLSFIDQESSISRGSIGQSVDAVISSLPNASNLLRSAIRASDLDLFLRECAALILAENEGQKAIADLSILIQIGSWFASEVTEQLRKYGSINPYS